MNIVKILSIIFAYCIGIGELILAGYFWKTHSGNTIRKVLAFLLLCTGLWVGTTAITVYRSPSATSDFLVSLVYVFGTFGLTSLLYFLFVYPLPIFRMSTFRVVALYVPAIILSILLLFTKLIIVENVFGADYYGRSEPGSLFIVYNLFLLILFLAILATSFYRWYPRNSFHRENTKIVFWSILLGGLPTIILDLIATSFFKINPNPLYGVLTNAIWVGAIVYIVLKK